MTVPLLVIAAGGTGGHMFPAQALAEAMLARGWRVMLTTDARGLRYAGGFPDAVERIELPSATLGQGGLMSRLLAPFTILRGVLRAIGRFRADRPACVAGFGGYPSLPALSAAWLMGLPRLIHEQNGVLGRVNRIFARHVDQVCCGTWPLVHTPAGARLQHVGNPVRASAAEFACADYVPAGAGEVRLLVFGGSQGASVFARLVPQALALLPEALRARIRLTQQVRPGEEDEVGRACRDAGIGAELAPFFADMPARIAGAHLVIARAGASTIAELTTIGRPAILVPYPHATDDHQSANATAIAAAGGAIVMRETGLTPDLLAGDLARLLIDPVAAARMAAASRSLGKPDAAATLAGIVATLGNRAEG